MFAIAGIVLLLAYAELRVAGVTASLPVPLLPVLLFVLGYGFVVDVRLRRTQLIASPLFGWALALAAWSAFRVALAPSSALPLAPMELALPFVLFFALSQGVQRFAALGTVAATLLLLALAVAARDARHDPGAAVATLAVATPLGFAYVARNRSAPRVFLLLLTLVALAGCVILTRSRPARLAFDWPTVLLASVMLYLSLKVAIVILRAYADDPDAAVARSWARALIASLAALVVALFVAPAAGPLLFCIYTGLAAALYQATRAHDPSFAVRFGGRDLVRLVIFDVGILALACL